MISVLLLLNPAVCCPSYSIQQYSNNSTIRGVCTSFIQTRAVQGTASQATALRRCLAHCWFELATNGSRSCRPWLMLPTTVLQCYYTTTSLKIVKHLISCMNIWHLENTLHTVFRVARNILMVILWYHTAHQRSFNDITLPSDIYWYFRTFQSVRDRESISETPR